MSKTTTYEAPDAAAVAAKAVTDYQAETDDVLGEKMVLNMGPSHPATHGVLRLVLELDGEIIEKAEPHIGYLHEATKKSPKICIITSSFPTPTVLIILLLSQTTSPMPVQLKNSWGGNCHLEAKLSVFSAVN
jgi:hypothetical protein